MMDLETYEEEVKVKNGSTAEEKGRLEMKLGVIDVYSGYGDKRNKVKPRK